MASHKTTMIRLFGFDATEWSMLILGVALSALLVFFF
jgi:hypothetical protein